MSKYMKKRKPITEGVYGYKHLEKGHPDNPKNYNICGARTRNIDAKGPYCRLPAGFKTDHFGVGRCKIHGGCNGMGPNNKNWKGGRYADLWRGRLKEHYSQIHDDKTNPLDLMPELEVARVTLRLAVERMLAQPGQPTLSEKSNSARSLSDSESLTSDSSQAAPGGPVSSSLNGYQRIIPDGEFLEISESEPPEYDYLLISPDDLILVRECTNDIVNTVSKMIAARNQTALTRAEVMYMLTIMKDAIKRFVPRENQEAFVKYLIEMVPAATGTEELPAGGV